MSMPFLQFSPNSSGQHLTKLLYIPSPSCPPPTNSSRAKQRAKERSKSHRRATNTARSFRHWPPLNRSFDQPHSRRQPCARSSRSSRSSGCAARCGGGAPRAARPAGSKMERDGDAVPAGHVAVRVGGGGRTRGGSWCGWRT